MPPLLCIRNDKWMLDPLFMEICGLKYPLCELDDDWYLIRVLDRICESKDLGDF